MSTRSNIRVMCKDTQIREIYVHMDGMSHLETLQKWYNDQDKAEALIALGDLSVLDKSTEKPDGHDFDHRIEGYTVAYHRDRGEPWEDVKPKTYDEFAVAWMRQASDIEYVYEWDTLAWHQYKVDHSKTRFQCIVA